MKRILFTLPASLLVAICLISCEKGTSGLDIDYDKCQVLALNLSKVSKEADILVLGEDGSGMVYDADNGEGHGILYYSPEFKGNLKGGVSILLDRFGKPQLVSYDGMYLLFTFIDELTSDLLLIDKGGKPHFFYDVRLPQDIEGFFAGTKGPGDNTDFVSYAITTLSMASTALGFTESAPVDFEIGSFWDRIRKSSEEYEEITYKKSYSSVIDEFAGGAFDNSGINPEEAAKTAGQMREDLWWKKDDIAGHYEKHRSIKLSIDEDHSLGSRRNLVIDCGPSEGTYIVNVEYYGESYNHFFPYSLALNQIEWLDYWEYGNNDSDPSKMAITVKENTTGVTREGIIRFIEELPATITIRQKGADSFKLSQTLLEFDSEGGEQVVNVQAPSSERLSWYVSGAPDWCHVICEEGSMKIKVDSNNGSRDESCLLTVTVKKDKNLFSSDYHSIQVFQGSAKSCPDIEHPHAIDLGLSVEWACMNIGSGRYEQDGDHFAWGETATKDNYAWETYKWIKGAFPDNYNLTKYVNHNYYGYDPSYVDYKETLDLSDDAANENWGAGWRMPTQEEFSELVEKCTWTSIKRNGIYCMKVTGPNGNYIILPITHTWNGDRPDTSLYYGEYWSSSLAPYAALGAVDAFFLTFNNAHATLQMGHDSYNPRYMGMAVRPVKE